MLYEKTEHHSVDSSFAHTGNEQDFVEAAISEDFRGAILRPETDETLQIRAEISTLRSSGFLQPATDPRKPFIGEYTVFFPNSKTDTVRAQTVKECGITVPDKAINLRTAMLKTAKLLHQITQRREITALFANNSPAPLSHRHPHHTLTRAWFRDGTCWAPLGLSQRNIGNHYCHSNEGEYTYLKPETFHSSPLPESRSKKDYGGLMLACEVY